jgi:hypothetical protein
MYAREQRSSIGRVIFWAGSYLQVCSGYGNDSRQNEPFRALRHSIGTRHSRELLSDGHSAGYGRNGVGELGGLPPFTCADPGARSALARSHRAYGVLAHGPMAGF